jgi:hypothetical protein
MRLSRVEPDGKILHPTSDLETGRNNEQLGSRRSKTPIGNRIPQFWAGVSPTQAGKYKTYKTCVHLALTSQHALGVTDPTSLCPAIRAWSSYHRLEFGEMSATFLTVYFETLNPTRWSAIIAQEAVAILPWRVELRPGLDASFDALATYLFYLSRLKPDRSFFMSARKAGTFLGKSHDTGSRYLRALALMGVIHKVQPGGLSPAGPRCATSYVWVGARPSQAQSDVCQTSKSDTPFTTHISPTTLATAPREIPFTPGDVALSSGRTEASND